VLWKLADVIYKPLAFLCNLGFGFLTLEGKQKDFRWCRGSPAPEHRVAARTGAGRCLWHTAAIGSGTTSDEPSRVSAKPSFSHLSPCDAPYHTSLHSGSTGGLCCAVCSAMALLMGKDEITFHLRSSWWEYRDAKEAEGRGRDGR